MTSRTLPRFVSAMIGNSPMLVAERILATCEDQSRRKAAFAVMMDHKRRIWIDRPDAAIPDEHVCTVTVDSDLDWLAEELATELLRRAPVNRSENC